MRLLLITISFASFSFSTNVTARNPGCLLVPPPLERSSVCRGANRISPLDYSERNVIAKLALAKEPIP